MEKNLVIGLGEIGRPILRLISKAGLTIGYDVNPKLVDIKKFEKYKNVKTTLMHICIPYNDEFISNVKSAYSKFNPSCIIIHSTIKPHTTKLLQKQLSIPIIYSATRGIHKRMFSDLKRYTKFYAIETTAPRKVWASKKFVDLMKSCGVKTKKMSKPLTLELAKIVIDTTYYGWLITYSQISNMIAIQNKINYDEMWSFSDEIHKILGNRPKMFPGFIGGHCIIPNLELLNNDVLNLISEINLDYAKILKNRDKK